MILSVEKRIDCVAVARVPYGATSINSDAEFDERKGAESALNGGQPQSPRWVVKSVKAQCEHVFSALPRERTWRSACVGRGASAIQ
jgi:hypothetical protein